MRTQPLLPSVAHTLPSCDRAFRHRRGGQAPPVQSTPKPWRSYRLVARQLSGQSALRSARSQLRGWAASSSELLPTRLGLGIAAQFAVSMDAQSPRPTPGTALRLIVHGVIVRGTAQIDASRKLIRV